MSYFSVTTTLQHYITLILSYIALHTDLVKYIFPNNAFLPNLPGEVFIVKPMAILLWWHKLLDNVLADQMCFCRYLFEYRKILMRRRVCPRSRNITGIVLVGRYNGTIYRPVQCLKMCRVPLFCVVWYNLNEPWDGNNRPLSVNVREGLYYSMAKWEIMTKILPKGTQGSIETEEYKHKITCSHKTDHGAL